MRRRSGMPKLGLGSLLVAGAMLATVAPASAVNVVKNPGAEQGIAGGYPDTPAPPEWQTTTAAQQRYVSPGTRGSDAGFPDTSVAQAVRGGVNFFTGGTSARSTATQTIGLEGRAELIDRGSLAATLSAALGGFATQGDNARVTATFLDAAGAPVLALGIGPVTAADRGGTTTLLQRTSPTRVVPAGARSVVVTLIAQRVSGRSNDGYADNIVLDLDSGGVPQPVVPRFLRALRPVLRYRGGELETPIAIVRHGAEVRFCNRDPVFHRPFAQIPGGGFPVPVAAQVPVRPRSCVNVFSRLLAPGNAFRRQLARIGGRRGAVARRQVAQGFDGRTGRLLAPRRPGKRGVCWRIFDGIDADIAAAVYVLPKGQRRPTRADIAAARACFPGRAG